MLIKKPISKNEVVTIKLTSGEELIGSYVSESADSYQITKVRAIGMTNSGVGLAPYIFTSDVDELPINKSAVVTIVPSLSEYAKQYTELTTSIQLLWLPRNTKIIAYGMMILYNFLFTGVVVKSCTHLTYSLTCVTM